MNVLVTGATGFIGRHVVRALWESGHSVRVYVRPRTSAGHLVTYGVEVLRGSLWERAALERAFRHSDCCVHLVGAIVDRKGERLERVNLEGTQAVLAAAQAAGIRKFVHMSALGVRAGASSRYHRSKFAAEEAVRASGLASVILRPSIVFGPGEQFFSRLAAVVRSAPFVPVLGAGTSRIQPIAVEDVARAFVRAVEGDGFAGRAFELGGPRSYTMDETLRLILKALGLERRLVHIPPAWMTLPAWILERLSSDPLLTVDQLRMVTEDNVCDPAPARSAFGLALSPLEPALPALVGAPLTLPSASPARAA